MSCLSINNSTTIGGFRAATSIPYSCKSFLYEKPSDQGSNFRTLILELRTRRLADRQARVGVRAAQVCPIRRPPIQEGHPWPPAQREGKETGVAPDATASQLAAERKAGAAPAGIASALTPDRHGPAWCVHEARAAPSI